MGEKILKASIKGKNQKIKDGEKILKANIKGKNQKIKEEKVVVLDTWASGISNRLSQLLRVSMPLGPGSYIQGAPHISFPCCLCARVQTT